MRLLVSSFLLPGLLFGGSLGGFRVLSDNAGAWPQVLSSVGFRPVSSGPAKLFVLRPGAAATPEWTMRVEQGAFLILEGESSVAEMFGFRALADRVRVVSLQDVHRPGLSIVWGQAAELPRFALPRDARIFAKERWSNAPLMAGFRRGAGAVLWVAASLGEQGYERFPYVLQALSDLGLEPPFRSSRLWAFFDSAYRSRVDLEYFARRWQASGIAAVHVAAWHFYDRNPQSDEYLRTLIAACHRSGVLVYAWLELPHVSEAFWDQHPEWREKTAVLQDARLDWRKLMNLRNRDCFGVVSKGVKDLIRGFDWDGVNLAELYFESLEGIDNPSRFTPMNPDVRAEFRSLHGFDPVELFQPHSDLGRRRLFLDYRAALARRMQEDWLGVIDTARREKSYLDVVLTHVDDRFDQGMREAVGADAAEVLPLIPKYRFTFLIEDPATVWNLGSRRYPEIAKRYEPLTTFRQNLAIDINIVDRYQDVYPTKQQTGTELFQLVHVASEAFSRVALYFETSLLGPDLPLLSSAGAAVRRADDSASGVAVDSPYGVGLAWSGRALVDGRPWPVSDERTVWVPAGEHVVAHAPADDVRLRVLAFNGGLDSAEYLSDGRIELSYHNEARAFAVLNGSASGEEVDGLASVVPSAGPYTLILPPGQHVVTIRAK